MARRATRRACRRRSRKSLADGIRCHGGRETWRRTSFLALKNLELLFAYDLEMNCLRIRATNQKHILVLLPGERVGDRITLFHEASTPNHRTLPMNIVPENHLWELSE